ncbi:MAG: hypothetical protein M3Q71_06080 [Chloroflexota bacterium]|nr:hypothetical protein [Chloroflexota bacterium]MDP9470223.1 hypothetical protein [Chloroflexota bacterium]
MVDDDIDALVIDPANGIAQSVIGIPDIGRFRRIAVSVPYLDWSEDAVFRVGGVVVRLVKQGRLLHPTRSSVDSPKTAMAWRNDGQQEPWMDRFVEIVAPEGAADEDDLAFAILGLLALVVGDAVVGDLVMSDTREFVPHLGSTEYSVSFMGQGSWLPSSVSLTLRLPVLITEEQLDAFDRSLAVLTAKGPLPDKIALALRWYERELRSFSPIDRLLASFVGIEATITVISEVNRFQSPIADLLDDDRIPALLQPLVDKHGEHKVDRLRKRLVDKRPSMLDRFDFAAGKLGLSSEASARFRSTKNLRDAVMHGSNRPIGHDAATAASGLLAEVIRSTIDWLHRVGDDRA